MIGQEGGPGSTHPGSNPANPPEGGLSSPSGGQVCPGLFQALRGPGALPRLWITLRVGVGGWLGASTRGTSMFLPGKWGWECLRSADWPEPPDQSSHPLTHPHTHRDISYNLNLIRLTKESSPRPELSTAGPFGRSVEQNWSGRNTAGAKAPALRLPVFPLVLLQSSSAGW
jgi:hypothetical protein